MPLTDTFVRNAKYSGRPSGDKHADGGGMYLHISASGKYWRMAYRFADKQKTLSLGVYPEVTLAEARKYRETARKLLAQGVDPSAAKREAKALKVISSGNTFELVALEWLKKSQGDRMASTHLKVTNWLEKDIFPYIGRIPISDVGPRDVLAALRHMEGRGALDSTQRVKQVCGQVFRYAVACGFAERDVTQDLKGALAKHKPGNFAAITDPKMAGQLLRSIFDYQGHHCTVAALKLSPLLFVRPGELRMAEWSEFDFENSLWTIPAENTKSNIIMRIHLTEMTKKVLRELKAHSNSEYVITGADDQSILSDRAMPRAVIRIQSRVGIPHWTAHDLRRTFATQLGEALHVDPVVIEKCLGHKMPKIMATYNKNEMLPQRKEALERWSQQLESLSHDNSDVAWMKQREIQEPMSEANSF